MPYEVSVHVVMPELWPQNLSLIFSKATTCQSWPLLPAFWLPTRIYPSHIVDSISPGRGRLFWSYITARDWYHSSCINPGSITNLPK